MGYILDIHETIKRRESATLLKQKAEAEFAKLNGWNRSRSHFEIVDIGKSGRAYDQEYIGYNRESGSPRIYDHVWLLRRGRVHSAIVTEPYNVNLEGVKEYLYKVKKWANDEVEEYREHIAGYEKVGWKIKVSERLILEKRKERAYILDNLDVYSPPDILASIWNPGGTSFFVIAEKGLDIRWLDEQDGRLAGIWAKEQELMEKEVERRRLLNVAVV